MAATAAGVASQATARSRLRAALAWLHLWVGLGAGLVFAVLGLSGSALVFHDDLLRWQHPQLAAHAPRADGVVLETIVARWRPRGLRSLDLPRAEMPVWQGYFADGSRAFFAPADGSVLLRRTTRDDPLLWLRDLHTHLLGGARGEAVLGVAGWISLGLLLSGLYLWWPKRGRLLAQLAMHAGPPPRRWLSWHRSSGALALPLLALVTVTGVGMVYHEAARAVLTAGFGGGAMPSAPDAAADTGAPDWPRVLSAAHGALPRARLARLSVPAAGDGVVTFRARASSEWHPVGRSLVHLAPDGRVLQVHDASTQARGARMTEAIYPLHIGAVGGGAYKWLVALSGLLPAFLLATGFLFWRRKSATRAARR